MADKYYEPNMRDVNAEIIDGEAIIINVATGVYYSLEHSGAYVWELLTSGHSVQQTVQAIVSRYPGSAESAQQDLDGLVTQLLEEKLISEKTDSPSTVVNGISSERSTDSYRKPELNIYRDMGDLLALDPPTPGLTITSWDANAETADSNE
jgi:hypothetical protein